MIPAFAACRVPQFSGHRDVVFAANRDTSVKSSVGDMPDVSVTRRFYDKLPWLRQVNDQPMLRQNS